jgi:hypothetical protein
MVLGLFVYPLLYSLLSAFTTPDGAFGFDNFAKTVRWQEAGFAPIAGREYFAPIAREYIAKLKPENGVHRNISENGDLDVRRSGKLVERRKLMPALKAPAWLDPKTGGPRL